VQDLTIFGVKMCGGKSVDVVIVIIHGALVVYDMNGLLVTP